jgi:transcriptional regulator with GAF, ATPase, and Fis domain
MITTFQNAVKNSGKLSLAMTVVFSTGILISTYFLFTLPHDLTMKGGLSTLALTWPVLINLFVIIGLTFIAGIATVQITIQSRKETVVYLEKKNDGRESKAQEQESLSADSKNVAELKEALDQEENEVLQKGLNIICQQLQAGQGALYQTRIRNGKGILELTNGFALPMGESSTLHYEVGEGLIGQAAASGTSLYLDEVPEGYITIVSGLGTASPRFLMVVPIKKDQQIKGVLEIATFSVLTDRQRKQVEDSVRVLAEKIN